MNVQKNIIILIRRMLAGFKTYLKLNLCDIGIGKNDINKTKVNTASQWKQYDLGPRIPPILQIKLSMNPSK